MTGDTAPFVPLAALAALPEGCLITVRVSGRRLMLLRRGETVLATSEQCPHAGASLVAGEIEGTVVTCVAHRWRFDLRDGRCLDGPYPSLETYPTRTIGRQVFVQLADGEATTAAGGGG